jgi:hypothetical protein
MARRRGPIEISGQDGAVLGNQVNAWDGSISVNKYGMNHNTRWSIEEVINSDKIYDVWEELGRPIYFEVSIMANNFIQITLMGEKCWAEKTEVDRTEAAMLLIPDEEAFIYDEEFTRLKVEICEDNPDVMISIYASGFIPDSKGVNHYRNKIDKNM